MKHIEIVDEFKSNKIRTSIFLDPKIELLESVINIILIELNYILRNMQSALQKEYEVINKYMLCANEISKHGIGINAGHDLSLSNIKFLK